MSVRALERKFHTCFHVTPQKYLRKLRLRKASRALVYTGQTLAEVASGCGFSDQSPFTRVFRQQFGLTPQDYREHVARGEDDAAPVPKPAANEQEPPLPRRYSPAVLSGEAVTARGRSETSPMLTKCLSVIPAAVLLAASLVGAADEPSSDGFVSLFNGKDLSGWKVPEGDGGHWKVLDGVIDYDAGSQAKGDKNLWSDREYGDFILRLDWRLKEAPFINKSIPYILPDGTHAKDIRGKELRLPLPDADSGVFLRGNGDYQVNIWCWPIGSGEMFTVRTDPKTAPDLRAAVTPRTRADNPVGEWNHFEITVKGKTVKVELNGKTVIPGATIPDLPSRGRIAFQHHGSKGKDGAWNGPPSLVQFKNIEIKELN
jgi:hypothetical protein